jgi:hypothetical protein
MNRHEKKKLCWNCEGSVSFSEETCPYCGVSVVPAFLEGAEVEFAPPYKMAQENSEIPKSPFDLHNDQEDIANELQREQVNEVITSEQPDVDEFKRVAIAMILLLSGSVFFLFSLALGLFSHHGTFTLQWDASYWFVYSFLALPMLFFGWHALMKV